VVPGTAWRLFGVDVPLASDPGKVEIVVLNMIALKFKRSVPRFFTTG